MSAPTRHRRRNARQATDIVVIYWRDIPAQVLVHVAGTTQRHLLATRYQKAIDKAARVAGLTDYHRYIQEWRRVVLPLDNTADSDAGVAATIADIDANHDRATLAALVRSGGVRTTGEA
jgi:hypothetical protein